MQKDFYKIIEFPCSDTKNGILYMYQTVKDNPESVPFEIKKVLFIRDMKPSDLRGGHTHHKTHQLLFCISGECKVDLDNGRNKITITLNKPNVGLLLYPYVWHVMHSFSNDTMLLVIADNIYDEKDYIRKYEDFIQQLPKTV